MPNYTSGKDRFIPRNLKLKVEPVRDCKHIDAIRNLLRKGNRLRDTAWFDLMINNGLRACDICKLKVVQVRKVKMGQKIFIRESKTSKLNFIILNKRSYKSVHTWIKYAKLRDFDYLFQSKFGGHLQSATIGDKLKALCNDIGLTGIRIGSHTLRKTWAFHQWKDFGVPLVVIMRRLNHSDPKITMDYLCITDNEVEDILIENEL